jgi:hypothetical protein
LRVYLVWCLSILSQLLRVHEGWLRVALGLLSILSQLLPFKESRTERGCS